MARHATSAAWSRPCLDCQIPMLHAAQPPAFLTPKRCRRGHLLFGSSTCRLEDGSGKWANRGRKSTLSQPSQPRMRHAQRVHRRAWQFHETQTPCCFTTAALSSLATSPLAIGQTATPASGEKVTVERCLAAPAYDSSRCGSGRAMALLGASDRSVFALLVRTARFI
jgi:hypothetical protein